MDFGLWYLGLGTWDLGYPRCEFTGKVAVNNIRDKYLGKALPKKHGQNPIKYYNC